MKMSIEDLVFCKELKRDLLEGASVIIYFLGKYVTTVLVRGTKKQEWEYEFKMYQTDVHLSNPNELILMSSHRGITRAKAIKKATREHYGDELYYRRQAEKKENVI